MIAERIGRHKVLLPINLNHSNICEAFILIKTQEIPSFFYFSKKKPFKFAVAMARTVQLLRHDAYCPITLSY